MIPIYHLESRILGRRNKSGERRSIVAKAAYRAGERLYDEYYDRHWNFETKRGGIGLTAVARAAYRAGAQLQHAASGQSWDFLKKSGVAYSEISLPTGAPEWMRDRQKLWNAVDGSEKRKDAQLARELIVAIPNFLSLEQAKNLVREFVNRELVSRGMVVDWSIHTDDPHNLHAHIMLTMRDVAPENHVLAAKATHEIKHAVKFGFLAKNRSWNETEALMEWRKGWAETTNEHLAQAGYACRVDHRSYKEQGIELIPGVTIGAGKERRSDPNLPDFIRERIQQQEAIQFENGERIVENPAIALKAIARIQVKFSQDDIVTFLKSHTAWEDQFERAYSAVMHSPELVRLNESQDQIWVRYTTRELLAADDTLTAEISRDSVRDAAKELTHDQDHQQVKEPRIERPAWVDEIHALLDDLEEKRPATSAQSRRPTSMEIFEQARQRGREEVRARQEALERQLEEEMRKFEEDKERKRSHDYDDDFSM